MLPAIDFCGVASRVAVHEARSHRAKIAVGLCDD